MPRAAKPPAAPRDLQAASVFCMGGGDSWTTDYVIPSSDAGSGPDEASNVAVSWRRGLRVMPPASAGGTTQVQAVPLRFSANLDAREAARASARPSGKVFAEARW